jgi:hypothetical protein
MKMADEIIEELWKIKDSIAEGIHGETSQNIPAIDSLVSKGATSLALQTRIAQLHLIDLSMQSFIFVNCVNI